MDEITDRFTRKTPSEEQRIALAKLNEAALVYSRAIRLYCHDNRHRAIAEEHVETAAMFAAKAVTHHR